MDPLPECSTHRKIEIDAVGDEFVPYKGHFRIAKHGRQILNHSGTQRVFDILQGVGCIFLLLLAALIGERDFSTSSNDGSKV